MRRRGQGYGLGMDEKPDDRPAGDTPEAHDEINPRDIPKDNPARQEADQRAEGPEELEGDRAGDSRAE